MPHFVRVADVAAIPDPGRELVEVEGDVVALFHVDGRFYCIDDVCTHDGGTLVDGELTDYRIACPRHGARFDIRSGAALSMPAVRPTRAHAVKVEDGGVWVAIGQPPGPVIGEVQVRSSPAPAAAPLPGAPVPQRASTAGEAVGEVAGTAATAPSSSAPSEDAIREWLKEVKDPELFVNVVDLGLIYGVTLAPADAPGGHHVTIDMTMTSPACPAGPQLIADTKRVVGGHDGIAKVEVRIVMDPPWTPDRMTDAARDQLGIF